MESITKFVSSWSYSRESAANRTMVAVGNPHLAPGFLLGYLLLGLIIVILAFWSQRIKLKFFKERFVLSCTGRDSSLRPVQSSQDSILTLLLMAIINGVTAVVLAVHPILLTCDSGCNVVYIVWFLSKSFGIVLHLLCASISVLHLCHPQLRVQLQILATVVLILTSLFIPLYCYFPLVEFIGLAVITFGLALAIIAKSFGSTAPPSAASSKRWIVFVAMFTFLIFYLPAFVLDCLVIRSTNPIEVEHYLVIYMWQSDGLGGREILLPTTPPGELRPRK